MKNCSHKALKHPIDSFLIFYIAKFSYSVIIIICFSGKIDVAVMHQHKEIIDNMHALKNAVGDLMKFLSRRDNILRVTGLADQSVIDKLQLTFNQLAIADCEF